MLSLTTTTASTPFLVSPNSLPHLSPHSLPSVLFIFNSRRPRKRIRKQLLSLNFVDVKETRSSCSLLWFSKGLCGGGAGGFSGFVRRCLNWDSEGDIALEAEILEFMKESKNPESFPSKKELVEAGRMDLVEGIVKRGGWLSLGWDLSDGEEENVEELGDRVLGSLAEKECGSVFDSVGNEVRSSRVVSYFSGNSSQSASSSGRSLEMAAEDESGVEGILNRLEKERNMAFGFGLREKGEGICFQSNKVEDDWHSGNSIDVTVAGLERSIKPTSLSTNNHNFNDLGGKLTQNRSFLDIDGLGNSLKPDMWRTWRIQRAGFSDADFEAAEISSNGTRMEGPMDVSGAEILEIREVASESLNTRKELNSSHEEINHNQIRDRLQHMELELSSVLCSLRSNAGEVASQKGHERLSDDLQELSDAWEFQENEIMNAQDRLRSIRAKLAVVEGKMALAIIDAQKLVEEKQNRIDNARRTLLLLRSACIVWPNSASNVLLAGSFDGWATQRKMEKSSTGVFSLCLNLYPGRYEIKFIVDGEWRIDPLRPIVNNNGYENNLLIIT